MKKLFIVWIALIFALSLTGLTLAQEKTKKEEAKEVSKLPIVKPSAEAKGGEAKEKAEKKKQVSPKPSIRRMGGVVTAVDPQGKTISIHQETVHHDRVMKLKLNEKVAKELLNIKPGDLINVWVRDKVITAFNKGI